MSIDLIKKNIVNKTNDYNAAHDENNQFCGYPILHTMPKAKLQERPIVG